MAVKSVGYMMDLCDPYKRSICRFKFRAFERRGKGRGLCYPFYVVNESFSCIGTFHYLGFQACFLGWNQGKNQVRMIFW